MTQLESLSELLQPGLVLVSAVWAIGTIKATTEKLGLRIDQLGSVINELRHSLNVHQTDLANLRERIIRLESESDNR